jgi:hypothetical protein
MESEIVSVAYPKATREEQTEYYKLKKRGHTVKDIARITGAPISRIAHLVKLAAIREAYKSDSDEGK